MKRLDHNLILLFPSQALCPISGCIQSSTAGIFPHSVTSLHSFLHRAEGRGKGDKGQPSSEKRALGGGHCHECLMNN